MRQRNTDRNRHGIPLHGGDKPRCIWPDCQRPWGIYEDTRMCSNHSRMISEIVNRHQREVDAIRQERIRQAMQREDFQKLDEWADRQTGRKSAVRKRKRSGPTIYYLQVVSHIKIGWTADLEKRMRDYPPNSQLLATEPGERSEEQRLHKMFAAHRTHGGEWYAPVPSILHHIDLVRKKHGMPPEAVVGAQPVTIPEPRPKQVTYPRGWSGGGKTSAA